MYGTRTVRNNRAWVDEGCEEDEVLLIHRNQEHGAFSDVTSHRRDRKE